MPSSRPCARAQRRHGAHPGRRSWAAAGVGLFLWAAFALVATAQPGVPLLAQGPPTAAGDPLWALRQTGAAELELFVRVAPPVWRAAAGGGHFQVDGFPARVPLAAGWAPALDLPLVLPPAGDVRIEVAPEGAFSLRMRADELAPRPGLGAQSAATGWRAAAGSPWVETQGPRLQAGVRLLPLRVRAVRALPDGALEAVRALRIRILLPAPLPPAPALAPVAGASATAAAAAINPGHAGSWSGAPLPVERAGRPARLGRQGDSWATATSPWVRLVVRERGVYVVTADALAAAGVDPATIDLEELRLFCGPPGALADTSDVLDLPAWMEPCALHIEDDGDGLFDAETRVYFLGNGPDGWRADLGLDPLANGDRYYAHPSARETHYWLCWGGDFSTVPLRMDALASAPNGEPLLSDALARVHAERNNFYDSRPRLRDGTWPRFFDFVVTASQAGIGGSITAALPGALPVAGATVRAALWGGSWGVFGPENDHWAEIRVDGDVLGDTLWEGVSREVIVGAVEEIDASLRIALYVPLRYDYSDTSAIGDRVYFDWAEVDYRRTLSGDDPFDFFVPASEAATHGYRISGLTQETGWLLLEASDPRQPVVLQPRFSSVDGGYAADFVLDPQGAESHLIWLAAERAREPARVEWVNWTGTRLRERTTPIDYLIVTVPELRTAAEALAAHRAGAFYRGDGSEATNAAVAIVETQQIYDEFAWGRHDPVALRNFLDFARYRWDDPTPGQRLQQVLFLGDAYLDPRGYLAESAQDLVPGYELYDWNFQLSRSWTPGYWGDDFFALLDGPDDRGLDLAIGRLPARHAQDAEHMVAKIIAAETEPPLGAWRTRMIFAADDVCQGNQPDNLGYQHMSQTESLVDDAAPLAARIEKLFLYEYGTECRYDRKPQASADLQALVAEGALLFNFVGHGSEVQIADERLLDNSSIASLANQDRPFFMITASCAVGKFEHGGNGLAVQALRMAERGALGVFSASSSASSLFNYNLNLYLLQQLFADRDLHAPRPFGPAVVAAKTLDGANNDRRYNLLGDPGARLAVPPRELSLELRDVPGVAAGSDTLIRGAAATLRGEVLMGDGAPVAGFDGWAQLLVLDSDIHREPLPGSPLYDYELPGARIYAGQVPVADGRFETSFFVPTALRTGTRGPARIYAYAYPEDAGDEPADACGALAELFIPEEREPAAGDTVGPQIELIWIDPEPLAAGSRLSATLIDSSGVYIAGLAPSRSVVLTIADRNARILVAEDLASDVGFIDGDFRRASLAYTLPAELPTGESLRLTLAASDNLGRRTSAAVDFQLGASGDAFGGLLGMVYAMPNPMAAQTRFLFELEREADIELELYTVSGRRILDFPPERFTPARAREAGILWNGRDADGDRVANGTYFYRVTVRGADGGCVERIERLAVLR